MLTTMFAYIFAIAVLAAFTTTLGLHLGAELAHHLFHAHDEEPKPEIKPDYFPLPHEQNYKNN